MSNKTRVVIVDDDPSVLGSTSVLMEAMNYETRTFPSSEAFLQAFEEDRTVDCLILDVRMPGMSGLELQEKLNGMEVAPPIVFVTAHGDIPMAVSAIRAGAADFIEKPFTVEQLIDSTEFALKYKPFRIENNKDRSAAIEAVSSLTEREREVFELIVLGETNKAIGRTLGISPRTVDVHRQRIRSKLNANRLSDLIRIKSALD